MKYKVSHLTKYAYTDPVPICRNQVRLSPRELPHQHVTQFNLLVKPAPVERNSRTDTFGNHVDMFAIQDPHKGLTVSATTLLELKSREQVAETDQLWQELVTATRKDRSQPFLDAYQFAFASPYVPVSQELADYARPSFAPERTVIAAATDLTARIFADFEYDPRATTLTTPVDEVFRCRKGVCQDFAHLQIACLRSLGVPARYVSGYLRTIPAPGRERLVGADASHAWLSVFCGELGWMDLDPTNNVIPGTDHITVAWGRDYGDVCPVQGVFIGGGKHSLSISVDVEAVD